MDSKLYLNDLRNKFNLNSLNRWIDQLGELDILVIGDIIIDEYVFVQPKGRAIKDPILSAEYINRESHAGGVLVVANHTSTFVNSVKLVTLIGDREDGLDFIRNALNNNISIKTFVKNDSPTTVKRRYIDSYRNNKLFKIEYINDAPISRQLTQTVVEYLKSEIPKHDFVIVCDFGHGFINDDIRNVLQQTAKFLCINVQSNSSNMGFNYVNHYKRADFLTLDEQELRLPLMMRFENINEVMMKFYEKFNYPHFLVTLGKRGSILFYKGKTYSAPAFAENIVDTVGAGDAVFAITSMLSYLDVDKEIIPFIGNCAGGIKVEYLGNKEYIQKSRLIEYVGQYLD